MLCLIRFFDTECISLEGLSTGSSIAFSVVFVSTILRFYLFQITMRNYIFCSNGNNFDHITGITLHIYFAKIFLEAVIKILKWNRKIL